MGIEVASQNKHTFRYSFVVIWTVSIGSHIMVELHASFKLSLTQDVRLQKLRKADTKTRGDIAVV